MEAAPKSTEETGKKWGSYSSDPGDIGHEIGGTEVGIGTGQSNTTIIVTWLNTNTDNSYGDVTDKADRAAYLCDDLSIENNSTTYDDWFLPSKEELGLMYTNLHKEGVGDLGFSINNNWYYSSSETSATHVWIRLFEVDDDGTNTSREEENCKYYPLYVRAVRAF